MTGAVIELNPPPALQLHLAVGQGPAGRPGTPGGSGAEYTAATPLGGHRAIALDATGQAVYASSDSAGLPLRVAGISLGAAAAGDPVTVQAAGLVEHAGWAFVPDQAVFVGLEGQLVQTLPPGALVAQVLGLALSPTRVLLALQPPIVLAP